MGRNSEEHPSCQALVKAAGQVSLLLAYHALRACFPLSSPRRKLVFQIVYAAAAGAVIVDGLDKVSVLGSLIALGEHNGSSKIIAMIV